MVRSGTIFLVLMTMTYTMSLSAQQRQVKPVMDLRYGQALYHFYQEQYFSSITDLMVANELAPITKQGVDPELLMGGLYLYYGLHDNARKIFDNLIAQHTDTETRDRAWFNIGRMQYQAHLFDLAKISLLKVGDTLTDNREAERNNMLANIHLREKDFPLAMKRLQSLAQHPDWEVYARYNMGIALIKTGDAKQGREVLNQISDLDSSIPEFKALRDKTNIALGYAHIRENQPDIAIKYFSKVRLHGPLSAKALLGSGWAWQQKKMLEKALIPWLELRTRPVIDTAVQESLLAIPYTLESMKKYRLAMNHYRYAVAHYDKELKNLKRVINNIRNGKFVEILRPAMITEHTLASEYHKKVPAEISVPYLHHLLESIDFQQAHRNYLDLIYLQKNLREWKRQFPAYDLMLKERKKHFRQQEKNSRDGLLLKQLSVLRQKRDQLATRILKIKQRQDFIALASEDEKDILASLKKAGKLLEQLQQREDVSEEMEKYRLYNGLMIWQLANDYTPRIWKVQSQLNQLDKALKISKKRLQSLQQTRKSAPQSFDGYQQKIRKKAETLNTLLKKTESILRKQEQHIVQHALEAFQKRYQQIHHYQVRARYSLARLHDRMTQPEPANIKAPRGVQP